MKCLGTLEITVKQRDKGARKTVAGAGQAQTVSHA